jgi:hypothetical protein
LLDRRGVIKGGAAGALLLSFGSAGLLSPAEACDRDLPFTTLKPDEAVTLAALGEVLLPGAAKAGIAYFVDHQLGVPASESLLIARYFNILPPYAPFYQAGIASLNQSALSQFKLPFSQLPQARAEALTADLRDNKLTGWDIPPPLFYTLVRSDALDVVCGDEAGFTRLGIPYMAHIKPPEKWS